MRPERDNRRGGTCCPAGLRPADRAAQPGGAARTSRPGLRDCARHGSGAGPDHRRAAGQWWHLSAGSLLSGPRLARENAALKGARPGVVRPEQRASDRAGRKYPPAAASRLRAALAASAAGRAGHRAEAQSPFGHAHPEPGQRAGRPPAFRRPRPERRAGRAGAGCLPRRLRCPAADGCGLQCRRAGPQPHAARSDRAVPGRWAGAFAGDLPAERHAAARRGRRDDFRPGRRLSQALCRSARSLRSPWTRPGRCKPRCCVLPPITTIWRKSS